MCRTHRQAASYAAMPWQEAGDIVIKFGMAYHTSYSLWLPRNPGKYPHITHATHLLALLP